MRNTALGTVLALVAGASRRGSSLEEVARALCESGAVLGAGSVETDRWHGEGLALASSARDALGGLQGVWRPPDGHGGERVVVGQAHHGPIALVPAPTADFPDSVWLDIVELWGAVGRTSRTQHQTATTLEQIFELAPALISIHRGPEHRYEFANRLFRDSTDGRPMIGRAYADAYPEFVAQGYLAIFDEIYRSGVPFNALGVRADTPRTPGGPPEERYWNVTFQPMRNQDGVIEGLITFAFEVTEHVRATRNAELAHARYDELVHSVGAEAWTVDATTWQTLWRGGPATDDAAVTTEVWREVHPADAVRVADARACTRNTGDRYNVEFRAGDDQAWRWYAESGHRAGDAIFGLTLDVTARKEVELERARIAAHLLDAQKLESLGVLAGGIAHDFNNLLTTILGNASLAEQRVAGDPKAEAALSALIAGARRASDLTRQLLAYSGRGHFQIESVNLDVPVNELQALLGSTLPKTATLEIVPHGALPAIRADVAQVHQVLLNLVLNGAEALEGQPGRVTVRTGVHRLTAAEIRATPALAQAEPGRFVFLEVTDTGVGMTPAKLARIFDPFFTTKVSGRGLGLAAVEGIMRGHKGFTTVNSQPGAGTTFRLLFPIADGAAPPAPEPSPVAAPTHAGGRALVVDDEAGIRDLVRTMLEMNGYTVDLAGDGVEAVERFTEADGTYDIVVLDLTMPRMGGEACYRELARIRPGIRVLLSSGYNEEEASRLLLGDGNLTFIQKPYTLRQLIAAVNRARAQA